MKLKVLRVKPTEHFAIITRRGSEIASESIAPNASAVFVDPNEEIHIIVYTPSKPESK